MQVILQEDHPGLGFVGDVVNVKPGFARNYLIPKKIGLVANDNNMSMLQHRQKLLEVKKAEKKAVAEQLKDKLEGVIVEITHAAGEGDRLFGSVTTKEIHEQLVNDHKFDVDRKLFRLEAPIKTVGEHFVEVRLHQEVSAQIKVNVKGEVSKKVEKKVEKAAKAETAAPAEAPAAEENADA